MKDLGRIWPGERGKGRKKGTGMALGNLRRGEAVPAPRGAVMGCAGHIWPKDHGREAWGAELTIEREHKTNKTTFHF